MGLEICCHYRANFPAVLGTHLLSSCGLASLRIILCRRVGDVHVQAFLHTNRLHYQSRVDEWSTSASQLVSKMHTYVCTYLCCIFQSYTTPCPSRALGSSACHDVFPALTLN